MPIGPQRQPLKYFTIDVRPESIRFDDNHPRHVSTAPVQRTPWMTALWRWFRNDPRKGKLVDEMFRGNMVDDDGCEWEMEQHLGEGTYGLAALLNKVDSKGTLRDQVVLKAGMDDRETGGRATVIPNPNPKLPREAALQAQLSARVKTDQGVYDPFIYLRQFKHASRGDDLYCLGKSCTHLDMISAD
jgi:hypothetical protein